MKTAPRFSIDKYGDAAVVRLCGDLQVDHVPEVYGPLTEALAQARVVVVDLSDVNYIDSAGIAALIGLYKRIAARPEGRLVLCGACEAIWGVFSTMKLDRLFPHHVDLEHALQAEGLVDRELTQG